MYLKRDVTKRFSAIVTRLNRSAWTGSVSRISCYDDYTQNVYLCL